MRTDAVRHAETPSPLPQKSNCGVGVLMNLSGGKEHEIIADGFELLENLDHRGARGAEQNTGDGAGILIQKPHEYYKSQVPSLGDEDAYGVGQVFFPNEDTSELRKLIETAADDEGFDVVAWRDVPTNNEGLGETALETEPDVWQFFVEPKTELDPDTLDSALYVLRRVIETRVASKEPRGVDRFYLCSLDRRKVVYKGLLTNAQVRDYYPELSDHRVKTEIVLVHSRFSTNTLGAWELAHPYRNIIHNGEINTLRGNLNWMKAREADLEHPIFGDDIDKLTPVTDEDQSDTAVVDNVLELLVESGRSPYHALRMLVPEAWEKADSIDRDRKDWYRFHSTINEPWDGPALIAYTDGSSVSAVLDRNGLRPARYLVTEDDRLIMASETGAVDVDPEDVRLKDRLRPGQMFYADPDEGRIVPDEELWDDLTDEKYGSWLASNEIELDHVERVASANHVDDVTAYQRTFGYTRDHVKRLVEPMAEDGKDPVGAMGNDTPLSVLSSRNKTLFTYFKQLFAQVSNPPIDYIREDVVTSLEHHVGSQNNLLEESPEHCRQLHLDSPILTRDEGATIAAIDSNGIRAQTIDITYESSSDLESAIQEIKETSSRAVENGAEILYLTDRRTDADRLPIPSLLATGAIHHHLVREGLRTHTGIVVESGQPNAVHHFSTLLGYGADAIVPYLAYRTIETLADKDALSVQGEDAIEQYRHAVEHGIQKVMSKMGISTLESYKGAQIFEAVGLDSDFVAEFFNGTPARTEGIGLPELEADLRERHDVGFDGTVPGTLDLDQGGEIHWRREGEFHQWNPSTIGTLQHAAMDGDFEAYRAFATQINDQNEQLQTLRGLLEFDTEETDSIPLEKVEPVEAITERFFSGSMSFGSLSKEAHETLAEGMNMVGGYAGTGEGGEQTERYGTDRECANKQVASGRFGVDANYLANADILEIKMAQGSKPGEGGHLPGEKVDEVIAETRSTTPGVPLISPPPHHDIYSIEDLAQLIHDLNCSNPKAEVHVKLVSEAGVGIIAAGVSKGKADSVLISGAAGGTGASPRTSIKNAGLPWELGLAETQRVLVENDLRSRIRVRVDGGMKTGRDVAVAALMGAEHFGFGTAPLVANGCLMLRNCNKNTCPVGVATQDPELRDRFPGDPEYVANYMRYVAREVREIMADLGFQTMDEMIGRVDLLSQKTVDNPKANRVDLSEVLIEPAGTDDPRKTVDQQHGLDEKLDQQLLDAAEPAIENGEPVDIEVEASNEDRTLGAMVSSAVSTAHGENGLPDDTISIAVEGTGGQSFGAFLTNGISMTLEGDANDYVGKGLSGGKLVVQTPEAASYDPSENILIGNVALYGATDGEAYFNGRAGERFAVRNSGVKTVVEGVGDHGCEYMTGGVAVILGETGKNFAAGMSGGEAYVLDETGDVEDDVNPEMVHVESLDDDRDRRLVKRMVENHNRYTGSDRAAELLSNWDDAVEQFVKVMPDAYADVVDEYLEQGEDIRESPPPTPVEVGIAGRGDD